MHRIDVIVPAYNAAQTVHALVTRVLSLPVPENWQVSMIIANDGSNDDTADRLKTVLNPRLDVVELTERGGRANARNQAAQRARGDYLLFLDVDCLPAQETFFDALARQACNGADVVYGPIGRSGNGFWSRYVESVEHRRRLKAEQGDHSAAAATGIILIRRDLFEDVGGFDDRYLFYGFEDKDLIERVLAQAPCIVFEPGALVLHQSIITVAEYCDKSREAGRWTAPLFRSLHPETYSRMPYGRLDPDLAPFLLGSIMRVLGIALADKAVDLATWLVDCTKVPWHATALTVRLAAALSYMAGCADRKQY